MYNQPVPLVDGTILCDWGDVQSFFPTLRDYENSSGRYNYLFLKTDRTFKDGIDSHEYLGHGGMIDGDIADHSYDIIYNGQDFQNISLRKIYSNFSKGKKPNE